MKKYAKTITALLLAAALCSCSRIPDSVPPDSDSSTNSSATSSTPNQTDNNEYVISEFTIDRQDYTAKLNAEGGVYDNGVLVDGGEDELYDGKGYIQLGEGGMLSHVVTASAPQHYRIIIAARSEKGASVSFSHSNIVQGTYYIPPIDEDEFEDGQYNFKYYAIDNVYLTAGTNTMEFTVVEGTVDIDYLFVESSDAVSDNCYAIGTSCANPGASVKTIEFMQYLTGVYGKNVFTAQKVSIGTNAEIDMIFRETGRYPAIRVGELALSVLDDDDSIEKSKKEIELALDWNSDGGITAFTWHWYSPNSFRGTAPRDFSLESPLNVQNLNEVALLGDDEISALLENGFIAPELAALLNDLDRLAETLEPFVKADIPLIFEPIPDADSGLYWWGNNAEDYKKLWTLMFDRLCSHHGMSNLIWVWNGSNIDYYPGDRYVDIIGQSFYENSRASFAGRFSALSEMDTARKIQTVTACDTPPSLDYMYRDNAMWLWIAIDSGNFIINENGYLVENYTNRAALNYLYNHQLTIARDELKITH